MTLSSNPRVGVVGATGLVGRQLLRVFEERDFALSALVPAASERSAGEKITFRGEQLEVQKTHRRLFSSLDLVFMAAGSEASRHWIPQALEEELVVIDKSGAFRMEPDVPLVIPEVNGGLLTHHQGLIASPNCSTIQMVMALAPIERHLGLEWVLVTTYQSVSGTGRRALAELQQQARAYVEGGTAAREVYPYRIIFNALPHIGEFDEKGFCEEERKLARETKKILSLPNLPVSATTVRIPVQVGHCAAVVVRTKKKARVETLRDMLRAFPGISVHDDPEQNDYPTPLVAEGRDDVLVGRVRRISSFPRCFWLWIAADNLRKGAATNAIQIAERLMEGI